MFRPLALAALLGVPCTHAAIAQPRPTVRPADYGQWESLGPASLSPDGQWLAYVVNRVNEQQELRIGAAIFSIGFLVFTLLCKVAVPILTGEFAAARNGTTMAAGRPRAAA